MSIGLLRPFARPVAWRREINDALVIYSISILVCGATFYSQIYDQFISAQQEAQVAKFGIATLFLGIASATYGARRIADQRNERIRRLAAEEHATSLSLRDPLTLLPNRRCVERELEVALQQNSRKLQVLLVGLKQIQTINSLYGHAAGDAVLCCVATRLRQGLDGSEFLARTGDDEFTILTSGTVDRAARIASALIEGIKQPVQIGLDECVVETNVGIAGATAPQQGLEEVLRRARVALNRARELSADYCFFEPAMDARIRDRAHLEQDFRSAIGSSAVHLFYQPIVDVRTGQVESFEALARWSHPTRGLVEPDTFIALAEDLNLMTELSGKLFGEACRTAATWPRHISLSFNFSPRLLTDPSFGESVLAVLEETGLASNRLEVELTESTLVVDFPTTRQVIRTLKSAGVRISMDDFGTGYSCLRHLRELQFDKVKIDRSFVSGLLTDTESVVIVSAVAGLGRGLDIGIVAEGVENDEQLKMVRAAGCTHAQGFLLGQPRPATECQATCGPLLIRHVDWASRV